MELLHSDVGSMHFNHCSKCLWSFYLLRFVYLWLLSLGIRKSDKYGHNYSLPDCDDCCNETLKCKRSSQQGRIRWKWWRNVPGRHIFEAGTLRQDGLEDVQPINNLANETNALNFILKSRKTAHWKRTIEQIRHSESWLSMYSETICLYYLTY